MPINEKKERASLLHDYEVPTVAQFHGREALPGPNPRQVG